MLLTDPAVKGEIDQLFGPLSVSRRAMTTLGKEWGSKIAFRRLYRTGDRLFFRHAKRGQCKTEVRSAYRVAGNFIFSADAED